jgi:hypothetical protein
MIGHDLKEPGVTHMTERFGPRLVERERYAYLRPTVVHCDTPARAIASKEFMFPFVSVVECPQAEMLSRDATQIDRLNLGPVPTTRLNWLQPHEGNLIDFLFRSRALQLSPVAAATHLNRVGAAS